MRDNQDLDDILKRLADAQPPVDPAVLDRLSTSVGSGLQPADLLAPPWILTAALVLISAVIAIAIAIVLGPHGVQRMAAPQIAAIFTVLGVLILLSAALYTTAAIPGSRRPLRPWVLILLTALVLAATFPVLFHEYQTEQFIRQGLKCLFAGVAAALPVALANRLLLKRGFSVDPAAAGLAGGTLAGLAGIAMLEVHCPNFEVPHLITWHLAVLPLCAVLGMLAALWTRRPPSR